MPGLVRSGSGAGVALHEPLQDLRGLEDPPRPGHLLHRLGLVGLEVARVPVDVDAGAEAVDVELGVELRGVDVPADPERLHRARRGGREPHGVPRQLADRLLVADERLEPLGQVDQERVGATLRR